MLKFAAQRFPSSLLGCAKLQSQTLFRSTQWSHLAPLSVIGTCRSAEPQPILCERGIPQHFYTRSMFHSSPKRSKDLDLMDEVQKRYKHMMTQVDWREVKNSPQPALAYGIGGLIPFVLPPVAILLNGAFLPNLAFVQLAYGASILSFLGGIKWGFAVPENTPQKLSWDNLGQSVTFSLVAFGSLLLPPWMGTLALIAGMGASAFADITSPGYPQWFKAMRLCLSGVAIGSLLLGLFLRMVL